MHLCCRTLTVQAVTHYPTVKQMRTLSKEDDGRRPHVLALDILLRSRKVELNKYCLARSEEVSTVETL